ncbi:MAG: DUF11 domain-containing protein [Planctomycetes bacterium]|nr:DUF11 domain-containing protein [Planctomycetota bacterium]
MEHRRRRIGTVVLILLATVVVTGCSSYPTKFPIIPGGEVRREHGKPMEGGYYMDFDPDAATLEVVPVEDTNPVKTQHILIATVKDADGKPLECRRVEWIISEGSVGDIVEVDESGWYRQRGYKVDNKYAVSHTNRNEHVLTRGNDDPSDDITIGKGQTWCVITSPVEGDTHMVAYAPAIFNWDKHKVFVIKHWNDAKWEFPADATNPIGTAHNLAVKVMRASDGTPHKGWLVTFKVADGPDAVFAPGDKPAVTVKTGDDGVARVQLKQVKPVEGANTVEMEIVRPEDNTCGCKPQARIATGKMVKTWVGPRIDIKKSGPAAAGVGDQIQYAIVVTNPGRADATNVRVVDALPDGLEYVSSRPAATASGQTLTWSLGTLAAGGSQTLAVTAKTTRTGTFQNCAEVTADHGLTARDCATTVVTAPKLAIEKTGPAEVLICEPITYKIVVRNTGDGPATNVRVTDELPNGLTAENGRQTAAFDAGDLKPGEAKQATYRAKASKPGTYENTAVATSAEGAKAEATHKVIVRQPTLVLTKTGPETRFINREATYEITVSNKGDGEARNTVVTDTLPSGLTFVSATDGGQLSNGKVVWNVGTLAPNASRKMSMTVRATGMGKQRNTVTAVATCTDAQAEATTEVTGIAAILIEVKDVEDPIEIGRNETYIIEVTNQGSSEGTNIRVSCVLPSEQDYVSGEGPTQGTVAGKKITFAPLASLAPKAKAVYRVTVKANAAGDVRFAVEMISDQMTSPVNETESTHQYK